MQVEGAHRVMGVLSVPGEVGYLLQSADVL